MYFCLVLYKLSPCVNNVTMMSQQLKEMYVSLLPPSGCHWILHTQAAYIIFLNDLSIHLKTTTNKLKHNASCGTSDTCYHSLFKSTQPGVH